MSLARIAAHMQLRFVVVVVAVVSASIHEKGGPPERSNCNDVFHIADCGSYARHCK